jgi:prepilin-type N-terminal cleavage/methylation domain-containing protein/prepilin-type processing-associated H-X9-DG protein
MRRNGFTLVELLVVISIVSILAGLMLPVLKSAMESTRAVQCASQFKQIYLGFTMYADDWIGQYPLSRYSDNPNVYWMWFLAPYEVTPPCYLCPSQTSVYLERWKSGTPPPAGGWPAAYPNPIKTNVAFNYYAAKAITGLYTVSYHIKRAKIKQSSKYMLLIDVYKGGVVSTLDPSGNTGACYRHSNAADICYGDGHTGILRLGHEYGDVTAMADAPNGSPTSVLWTGE